MRAVVVTTLLMIAHFTSQGSAQMMNPWGDDGIDHDGRHHMDWPDSAEVVTLNGTVIVDSDDHMMPHYYLDTDNSGKANYMLGFGPWWYEPPSGAERPDNEQVVEIKGWLHEEYDDQRYDDHEGLPMLAVIEIDGMVWRDEEGTPPWSGNWVHRNANGDQFVFCPTDSSSWLEFGRGSMMGGGHGGGMMFPDSIYVQFELMHPDSLPGFTDSSCIAGFHVNLADEVRHNMMGNGKHGMGFQQDIRHRFHFTQEMMDERGIHDHEGVELRYYDSERGWQRSLSANYFAQEKIIDYSGETVHEYYGLFAIGIETGIYDEKAIPGDFVLEQNYPNPFNPITTIRFSIDRADPVRLMIYDILGQQVRELVNGSIAAGVHSLQWDARDDRGELTSAGIYFVELIQGNQILIKRMVLAK